MMTELTQLTEQPEANGRVVVPVNNRSDDEGATRSRWATAWSDGLGRAAVRSVQVIAVVALTALVIVGVLQLSFVFTPVLLALIVSAAIVPLIAWLKRHGIPALLATWAALLGIVFAVSGIIWLITSAVLNQWPELVDKAISGLGTLHPYLSAWNLDLPSLQQLGDWLTSIASSQTFQDGALAGLSATASFLTGFGIFIVVLFFFLKDGARIWEFLLRPFHGETYSRAHRVGAEIISSFGGYLRGTTVVAAVDAIGIGIGLVILQVPLALPLAVIVFLTSFIPLVGATLAGALAALVALVTQGPISALIVIAIVVVVNQLEGNLLQPVVMGRTLKLHPLVILIALTIGASLGGVLGAVIAVPLAAAGWAALQVWDGPDLPARIVRRKATDTESEGAEGTPVSVDGEDPRHDEAAADELGAGAHR